MTVETGLYLALLGEPFDFSFAATEKFQALQLWNSPNNVTTFKKRIFKCKTTNLFMQNTHFEKIYNFYKGKKYQNNKNESFPLIIKILS